MRGRSKEEERKVGRRVAWKAYLMKERKVQPRIEMRKGKLRQGKGGRESLTWMPLSLGINSLYQRLGRRRVNFHKRSTFPQVHRVLL